jgi:hypothetical protein
MNRYFCLLIYFALISRPSFSQTAHTIKGQVMDGASGSPIADCSVFINNTSKGTVTDGTGKFELSDIPAGKYQLIVSSIGYETYAQPFSGTQLPLVLTIRLKQKATALSAVTVEPFDPNGWDNWGKTFTDNFIGTTEYANQCTIKNKEVIHFRYSSKKDLLTAFSDTPIIIENKALGYILKYQLEQFAVNFSAGTNMYQGYPLFSDMADPSKSWEALWKKNREKAYYGSVMHFIRSLYINQLQGPTYYSPKFEVRRVGKGTKEARTDPSDHRDLTADDLVTVHPDQTKSLFFTGDLSVAFRTKRKVGSDVRESTIRLLTPVPVQIEVNGYYDPPLEIFMLGYWSLSEKCADLLPLDYWPGEN